MLTKFLSIFNKICPYCKKKLIAEIKNHSTLKSCPEGHYCLESHSILGVQIEHHKK